MRYRALISLTACGVFFGHVLAHEDTTISVAPDSGALSVPEEYQPASIVVSTSGLDTPAVQVTLSGSSLHLPSCLAKLFVYQDSEEFTVSGSWYHDFELLPPYVNIYLPLESNAGGGFISYVLVFNLETAELLEILEHEFTEGRSAPTATWAVDPSVLCSSAELEQLKLGETR